MSQHVSFIGVVVLACALGGCGSTADSKASASAAADSTAPKDAKASGSADKSAKKSDSDAKADVSAKATPPGGGSPTPTPAAGGATALAHLSDDCQIAVRLDFGKLVANPAMARDVEPTLDEILGTPSSKDEDFAKFQEFWKGTGLDYKKSIHDVTVCVTNLADPDHSWSVVIGADMQPDTLAPALAKAGKHPEKAELTDLDGHKVLVIKDTFTVGQAGDGVIIIAATKAMFQQAANAKGASFALDASKALAFVVREQAVSLLASKGDPKKAEPFKAIKKVSGFVDIDGRTAETVADCGTPDDAKKLDALITLMKDEMKKDAGANPYAADAVKTLASHADGQNVTIDVGMSQETFDQGVKTISEALKQAKSKL